MPIDLRKHTSGASPGFVAKPASAPMSLAEQPRAAHARPPEPYRAAADAARLLDAAMNGPTLI